MKSANQQFLIVANEVVKINCEQIKFNQIWRIPILYFIIFLLFENVNCGKQLIKATGNCRQSFKLLPPNISAHTHTHTHKKVQRIETNVWNLHCTRLCAQNKICVQHFAYEQPFRFCTASLFVRARERMYKKYETNNNSSGNSGSGSKSTTKKHKKHTPRRTRTESTNYIVYYQTWTWLCTKCSAYACECGSPAVCVCTYQKKNIWLE